VPHPVCIHVAYKYLTTCLLRWHDIVLERQSSFADVCDCEYLGWTLRSKEEKYIEAFEMWCYRRQKNSVYTTQDEWMRINSWQRTFGPCEVIEIGILWPYYTKIGKSGEANGSRMCKSWSTTPTLDRWHHEINEVAAAAKIVIVGDGTKRRQSFLWRKAMNDERRLSSSFPQH